MCPTQNKNAFHGISAGRTKRRVVAARGGAMAQRGCRRAHQRRARRPRPAAARTEGSRHQ